MWVVCRCVSERERKKMDYTQNIIKAEKTKWTEKETETRTDRYENIKIY